MKLYFREFGKGNPIIILHGLFGMSDNWVNIGKKISDFLRVILVDLRNHGRSPHSEIFNYKAMADDLIELINELGLHSTVILGHSMGGKVGMELALEYGYLVSSLIVVDIAPKTYYRPYFHRFIESLLKLDLNNYKGRGEIDRDISGAIPESKIRGFLLKNIVRDQSNQFKWRLNLKAIMRNLEDIMGPITSNHPFDGPALFIKGEKSDYITEKDIPQIRSLFPNSKMKTIPGASHWVHYDAPDLLLQEICDFLNL